MHSLKMTTALAVCISMSMPARIVAQDAAADFPCLTPTGVEAADAAELAASLAEYLSVGEVSGEAGNCNAAQVSAAFEAGGDDLTSLFENAPDALKAQLAEINPDLVVAVESEPQENDPVSEETADASNDAVDDAPADNTESAAEAEVPPAAVPAEETAIETEEQSVPQQDENVATAEPTQDPGVTTSEGPTIVESDGEEASPTTETAQADAATNDDATRVAEDVANQDVQEPAQTEELEAAQAQEESAGAGEADGTQLTDEERQALAEERQSELEQSSATAAAAASSDGTDATDASEPEVETQVIEETEVRRSNEDFETSAAGVAPAQTSDQDDGLSKLEKALLLGLGAAIVGSVLNNGDEVVSNSGDRVIIQRDGELRVLKNDDELLRRPGAQEQTQTYGDGSTRTVLTYEDGSQIITVRANDGSVLRRTLIRAADGEEIVLFDDTQEVEPIAFDELPRLGDTTTQVEVTDTSDEDALRDALEKSLAVNVDRRFSLQQIRSYKRVRSLAPEVELDVLTFASGSAAIEPEQAQALFALGQSVNAIIDDNPRAIFLVEGHTDAVGDASYNLALSDRRAETVALALTEYFGVPPQNLITQGYGETDLKIRVLTDERANRRASIRNITRLLTR